jgi:hypothetical protein
MGLGAGALMQTSLDLEFADGEYLFDLKLPQMDELQEKRGCGIFKLYGRVLKGRYLYEGLAVASAYDGEAYAEDLFETIRLGLIGGGRGMVNGVEVRVSALTAKALVERYCVAAPLKESWALAAAILAARIEGYEGKKKADPEPEKPKRRTRSTSRRSSETAPSSEPTGES